MYRILAPVIVSACVLMGAGTSYAGFEFTHSPTMAQPIKTIKPLTPVPNASRPIFSGGNQLNEVYVRRPQGNHSVTNIFPHEEQVVTLPPVQHEKYESIQTWRANRGELLTDVVGRWSERANVDFVWTSTEERHVIEQISHFGSFEEALVELFDVGMKGTVEGEISYLGGNSKNKVTSTPTKLVAVTALPLVEKTVGDDQKWKAEKGDTLQSVLRRWENKGGYKLVWDYPLDIPLPHHFYVYGTTQDALTMLLAQFNVPRSPALELYNDPHTNEKLLHVQ